MSYLIEMRRIGIQVKVTAIDPETGTEAVIIGPANAMRKDLTDLAVKKLEYVLKKNQ